ncbi:SPOSA6832_03736 [Sporobolomyces salmonicolor]|uniref:Spindle assembly checkpoint component MAD1 n=1 Tax=Sporidiobolus salmonicolor TaxID=5005 RepID=A0A0D6EPF5_SPOSA|nr:SPOSA6832_03736 [Sporobolomyces salmonicolor]
MPFHEAESEASSLKRQLARALREVEELKHTAERQKLESSLAAEKQQAQLDESAARIDKLERHRSVLLARERETAEREHARQSEADGGRAALEREVRTLRQQLAAAKDEHIDLQASFTDLEHSANQANASANMHKAAAKALQDEVDKLGGELEASVQETVKEQKRRIAIEAELEQEKLRKRESPDAELIREELHRQVTTLKTLERENGKLQRKLDTYERQHANIEVLKETNRSLEKKVKGVEGLRQQIAVQAVELEMLKREKSEWSDPRQLLASPLHAYTLLLFVRSAFVKPEDVDTFSSPRKITKNLAAQRIENATLRDRLNTHELEVQRRDKIIGQLEARANELEVKLDEAKKQLTGQEERSRGGANQVRLLQQEVGMLKRHLESYNSEEALNPAGNFDSQKTTRIAELEALLEEHKREIVTLSEQVSHWRGLVERYGGNTTEIIDLEERERRQAERNETADGVGKTLEEQLRLNEELKQELDEARNELALMEQEIEALSAQVEQLEENQGIRGAYNPATTKVLEFRDSPDRVEHAIRTATLELLSNENQALLRRLSDVERKGAPPGATPQELVPRESLVKANAEVEKLKALVAQKETMLKRISQAVAEKTENMRIAISKLLGYQLSFLDSGRIRVTSVYAPSKERSLAFDPWPGGPMPFKLVSATDEKIMRIDEVRRSIGFWLDSRSSLPGFMASLTMTLYEETTRGQAGGVVFG